MDTWMLAATFGIRAGQVAFGGGLLWSTLLLSWSCRRETDARTPAAGEAYLDLSVATSIGLTVLIFATIFNHYLVNGGFSLPLDTGAQVAGALKYAVFFVLWLHWGYVEIVLLHRFREQIADPDVAMSDEFRLTRRRVRNAHFLQLILFLVMLALDTLSQVLGTS